jgi:hypothetical protein
VLKTNKKGYRMTNKTNPNTLRGIDKKPPDMTAKLYAIKLIQLNTWAKKAG